MATRTRWLTRRRLSGRRSLSRARGLVRRHSTRGHGRLTLLLPVRIPDLRPGVPRVCAHWNARTPSVLSPPCLAHLATLLRGNRTWDTPVWGARNRAGRGCLRRHDNTRVPDTLRLCVSPLLDEPADCV